MKISRSSTTSSSASRSTESGSGVKKAATREKASTATQIAASADRFLQARMSAVGQLLNPLPGDLRGDGGPRKKAPDGAPNSSNDVENGGPNAHLSMEGTLGASLNGPSMDADVDPNLKTARVFGIDREQLAGGTQVDGRDPGENYSGGGGGVPENQHSGVGRESAGNKSLDVQASLEWHNAETQKPDTADTSSVNNNTAESYTGQYGLEHRAPTEEKVAAAAARAKDATDVGPEVNEL